MYFQILKSIDGRFYFVGRGNNHEVILTSQMYTQKQSAIHTINVIISNAYGSTIQDLT